ncbi:hypothetical protein LCGC14_1985450, partial [marine sediment metagenome]
MGMRRSGTTILQKLMNRHPDIHLEFEPYELFYSVATSEIPRYRKQPLQTQVLHQYKNNPTKWYGAKFAFNAGIEAMKWKLFNKEFDNAHFVFIIRNPKDTYDSWVKADKDSVRGICSYEMYLPWWKYINNSFITTPAKHTVVYYDQLVTNADVEMQKVWDLLKIKPITGLNQMIHKP